MSTTPRPKSLDDILVEFSQHRKLMQEELQKVIVGQNDVIEQLFAAIFTRGHCLLEGVPGLAKTLMVSTLARILDVGCGTGTYVRRFRVYSDDVHGLEVEPERVAEASRDLPGIVCGVGEDLPFPADRFDLVFSNEVIEHVADDRVGRAISIAFEVPDSCLDGGELQAIVDQIAAVSSAPQPAPAADGKPAPQAESGSQQP